MSFPHHDQAWVEAADFLEPEVGADDIVLAPDRFWWELPCPLQRWVGANFAPGSRFDWVVAHKGELAWVPRRFLHEVRIQMRPVFANAVFVVFAAADRDLAPVDEESNHLKAFDEVVAGLSDVPTGDNPYELDAVFGAQPTISRFADKSDRAMREAEDEFFRAGGYRYVTARDRGYYDDIHAHSARAFERWAGGRVLDIGCGGRALERPPPDTDVVRIDFSIEGVSLAAAADRAEPTVRHAIVDAHRLAFPDGVFDAVAIIDSVEHFRDAVAVFAEAARVLRPGGELFVTYANTNSVNQVLMGALGYPRFATNHQHIREFSPDEMRDLLEAVGIETIETAGVGLLPYWGVPGVDEVVRTVTDEDPEVVEMMRYLGDRGGDRYAYAGVILARKR